MLSSGSHETLGRAPGQRDWPSRPMTLLRIAWIFVAETESTTINQATRFFENGRVRGTLDDFLHNNVIGTPEQCLERLKVIESWGINYIRAEFASADQQAEAARLLLPLLSREQVRI